MNILAISPVIPVVVLDDPDAAVPLARALAAGGIGILELTLRTPNALECLSLIARDVPDVVVGAGTVTSPAQVEEAMAAGARFLVSPGTPSSLADALVGSGLPCLPGCSTISEALALRDRGFDKLKFFPAEAAGGPAFLSATAGPLPDLQFCPTGGITLGHALAYLALPNVPCVGGTWLTPAATVADHSWETVTAHALTALAALS